MHYSQTKIHCNIANKIKISHNIPSHLNVHKIPVQPILLSPQTDACSEASFYLSHINVFFFFFIIIE